MVNVASIHAVMCDFTGTLAQQTARGWECYADVQPALQQWRALGLHVGVLSNFDHGLPALLRQLGIAEFLDSVLYAEKLNAYKPAPEAFTAMAEATGVELAHTLYVGDAWDNDMAPCGVLGIPCVWLCRNGLRVPPLHPTLRGVVPTLTDVLRYV